MNSHRDSAEAIAEAVLSLSPVDRDAFLRKACKHDPRLRQLVEERLAEAADVGSFLKDPHPAALALRGLYGRPSQVTVRDGFEIDPEPGETSATASRIVGQFEILEKIGSGGMGIVYKAKDLALDRIVALKSLPPALIDDKDATARLIREAKTASMLDHPNICTIYQVLQTPEGQVFIAMCYYEGETIAQKLRSGPLPYVDAVRIATDVALGLDKAHRHSVVHRDIKPGNVILTTDGTTKILDFGLATLVSINVSRAEGIAGTVAYMSPEQLRGEAVDQRTDIWAWGVVLFEMLTGQLPFAQRDAPTTTLVGSAGHSDLPNLAYRTLPHGVAQMLAKALEKDPANRYPTIAEALSELRRVDLLDLDSHVGRKHAAEVRMAIPSIAVLPFRSLSSDPEEEYFSHGLDEELTDALANIDGLRVAPRSSVVALRATNNRLEIPTKLGAGFALEGSVRRSGTRVRINVQLINVGQQRILWSERFDREMSDIFAVQEEIAAKVVGILKIRFTDESPRLVKRYTRDLRAYNLYLKGRYQWNRESPEALFSAVETLRQATQVDPNYVSPLCGLAECYLVMGARALLPPSQAWSKARDAADKALSLDRSLADAHGCLGAVLAINDFDWGAAEAEFHMGLELNSDSALTRHWYAIALLAPQGRLNEAVSETSRAIEYEPLSLIYNSTLAWIHYLARNWNLAAEQCAKTLEIDPHHFDSLWCLASAYREMGRFDETMAILLKLAEVSGGIPIVYGSMGHSYGKNGDLTQAKRMLDSIEECGRKIYSSPICASWVYANLPGHENEALDCLERAFTDRDFLIRYIHQSPALDPIYSHPRFQSLVRQMGLQGATETMAN